MSTEDIFKLLEKWMNPDDFKALYDEQVNLHENLNLGEEIYATIPLKLNANHPLPHFRGR